MVKKFKFKFHESTCDLCDKPLKILHDYDAEELNNDKILIEAYRKLLDEQTYSYDKYIIRHEKIGNVLAAIQTGFLCEECTKKDISHRVKSV